MIRIVLKGGNIAHVGDDYRAADAKAKEIGGTIEDRNDWKSFDQVVVAAALVSKFTGETYLAVDNGEWVRPRYDIVAAPKVGVLVSYGFNGDYYPCGEVVKVGKNCKIVTTSTGKVFYRRKLRGSWIMKGGTWSLVQGHRDERNPSY